MRALICDNYEGISALRVGELPDPQPTPGSLVVKVAATAVNFADTLMVAGQYQFRPEPPFAPGYEFAGTVVNDGGVPGFAAGDRVCGFTSFGAMAEYVTVAPTDVAGVPDPVGLDEASVLPATYGTSYHALLDRAGLRPGESLLVLGGAGGVGLAAVQIGKMLGAKVVAAVSSAEKAALVTEAGADEVIRYDEEDLRAGIARTTTGGGVDVVYDAVGGPATETSLRSTKWNGRHLVVGFASGDIPSIPLNLPLLKGSSLVGVFWGRFSTEEPEKARANLARIVDLVAAGELKPSIRDRFSLGEGMKALKMVASRQSLGRVVINP